MHEEHIDRREEDGCVSKSQIKRELAALQQLGARLLKLNAEQWRQLQLNEPLLDALEESKKIRGHSAMRRHMRRLGKLLRDENTDRIEMLYEQLDAKSLSESFRFHRLERWRERLISEGDQALEDLLQQCASADRQHLRQLIRTCRKEREQQKPPTAQRKMFRYLRGLPLD